MTSLRDRSPNGYIIHPPPKDQNTLLFWGDSPASNRVQATTPTEKAPKEHLEVPVWSYRVATDGPADHHDRRRRVGDYLSATCLLILCCVLLAVSILLLILAIYYGVLYQNALAVQDPAVQAVVQMPEEPEITPTETTVVDDSGDIKVAKVHLGVLGGAVIDKYILTNSITNMQVEVLSHGARINSIKVPTISSGLIDVALGSDDSNLTNFQKSLFGAVNGRVCSAINWSFQYNGTMYNFNKPTESPPPFYMDGGIDGFYTRNFEVNYVDQDDRVHFLHNGNVADDNIPGNYTVHVIYQLTIDNELIISMTMSSSLMTPADMCVSLPMNLGGEGQNSLTGHSMEILSTDPTAMSAEGRLYYIQGSPILQFLQYHSVQPVVNYITPLNPHYDFTYSTKGPTGKHLVASARHSTTLIQVDVYSDQSALRFTVPVMDTPIRGKNNHTYSGTTAFVLQPHTFPVFNATNPSSVADLMLPSNGRYRQETIYKFSNSSA